MERADHCCAQAAPSRTAGGLKFVYEDNRRGVAGITHLCPPTPRRVVPSQQG
jgi:hypothetical protein